MGQILASFIIILFILFTFVPLAALNANHMEIESIKQDLNLAARVVSNSVESSLNNYEVMSEGYEKAPYMDIGIDKERLLREFYDVLEKNYYDSSRFEEIKDRIYLKILAYNDRFYIADKSDRWSPPYFFNVYLGGSIEDIAQLSISTDQISYYENSQKVYKSISDPWVQITKEKKNEIIIHRLNQGIAQYTYEPEKRRSLNIRIRNPEVRDKAYMMEYKNFNVLDGITFFVLYADDEELGIHNRNYKFRNYNVAGYTFNTK